MEREVKIYALVDPFTLKVRYIGRTVVSLPMRLSQHVHSAKSGRLKTHKEDWIRSLLKVNSKPYIRTLVKVIGWEESYKVESELIGKYKDRLVNHDDRGPGALRNHSDITRKRISDGLSKHFETNKNPAAKVVYVYNEDGSFYKEYDSIRKASVDLGYYFKTISKHLNGKLPDYMTPTKDGRKRVIGKGKQFSFTKVEKMYDLTRKDKNICRPK